MLTYTEQRRITAGSVDNPEILRLYREWRAGELGMLRSPEGEFDPAKVRCANDLMFLEQVSENDFVYGYYGANIVRAAGFSKAGKRTSDFKSIAGDFFIQKYLEALRDEQAIYTTHRTIHARGVRTWERLVLPLSKEERFGRTLLVYNRPMAFASELLLSVLDGNPSAILALASVHDEAGEITDFKIEMLNRGAEEEFGVRAADAMLQPVSLAVPGVFSARLIKRCVRVVRTGEAYTFTQKRKCKGRTCAHAVTLSPVSGGLVTTFTDITEFVDANTRLEVLATTDPLTKLFNRRGFMGIAEKDRKRSVRHGSPLCTLALDIDHFKRVNDTYGHDVGDSVLVTLADVLQVGLREYDTVGRLGGEEFAILLPETPLVDASALAERLRERVAATTDWAPDETMAVTVSVGVAQVLATDNSVQEALSRADTALYEAKHSGRNRVRVTAN